MKATSVTCHARILQLTFLADNILRVSIRGSTTYGLGNLQMTIFWVNIKSVRANVLVAGKVTDLN